jgi:hypothetical protein
MYPSNDSLGAFITHYVLEVDEGATDSDFSEVTSYLQTSFTMTHTLTYATDQITTGLIYTFRFKAVNEKGSSEYSEQVSIAANEPPEQSATSVVDYTQSTRNSIFVSWDLNEDAIGEGGLITGYKLYMDDGYGGEL